MFTSITPRYIVNNYFFATFTLKCELVFDLKQKYGPSLKFIKGSMEIA